MSDGWFTKNEVGRIVETDVDGANEALAAGRPIYVIDGSDPNRAPAAVLPEDWAELGSTRDDGLPPRLQEVLEKGGTIYWRSR